MVQYDELNPEEKLSILRDSKAIHQIKTISLLYKDSCLIHNKESNLLNNIISDIESLKSIDYSSLKNDNTTNYQNEIKLKQLSVFNVKIKNKNSI